MATVHTLRWVIEVWKGGVLSGHVTSDGVTCVWNTPADAAGTLAAMQGDLDGVDYRLVPVRCFCSSVPTPPVILKCPCVDVLSSLLKPEAYETTLDAVQRLVNERDLAVEDCRVTTDNLKRALEERDTARESLSRAEKRTAEANVASAGFAAGGVFVVMEELRVTREALHRANLELESRETSFR